MSQKNKMMSKEDAEAFLFKVDMEGLDYAANNYAPDDTGDKKFEKLLAAFREACANLDEYVEELRQTYEIEVS